ncbi:unnamed protein product, partial [Ectocarpus sp. 4 AP-2014]
YNPHKVSRTSAANQLQRACRCHRVVILVVAAVAVCFKNYLLFPEDALTWPYLGPAWECLVSLGKARRWGAEHSLPATRCYALRCIRIFPRFSPVGSICRSAWKVPPANISYHSHIAPPNIRSLHSKFSFSTTITTQSSRPAP